MNPKLVLVIVVLFFPSLVVPLAGNGMPVVKGGVFPSLPSDCSNFGGIVVTLQLCLFLLICLCCQYFL
jgi:hypothetical protein